VVATVNLPTNFEVSTCQRYKSRYKM